MRTSYDYRLYARNALNGKWGISVLTGFVAGIIGNANSFGRGFSSGFSSSASEGSNFWAELGSLLSDAPAGLWATVSAGAITVLIFSLITGIALFLLKSIINLGYSAFHIQLAGGFTPSFNTLFGYFPNWKNAIVSRFLQSLYVALWSLLLIVPGIVAGYSYAMTDFILAENPTMRAKDAIELSKQMMRGNRWRYFCLHMSFIGWTILCVLSCGIGFLWLQPYQMTANAAFYRDLRLSKQVSFDI